MAHIVLVEDNDDNRELLRKLLEYHGYRVTSLDRGGALLRLLEEQPADLVLLDVNLPDGNGLDLVRRLRGDPRHRDVPIIAVTAFAMRRDRERALAAGCVDYFSKPLDLAEVARVVARHLTAGG